MSNRYQSSDPLHAFDNPLPNPRINAKLNVKSFTKNWDQAHYVSFTSHVFPIGSNTLSFPF